MRVLNLTRKKDDFHVDYIENILWNTSEQLDPHFIYQIENMSTDLYNSCDNYIKYIQSKDDLKFYRKDQNNE